jgi:hypothetical protein
MSEISNSKDDLKSMPLPVLQKKTELVAGRSYAGRSKKAAGRLRPQRAGGK